MKLILLDDVDRLGVKGDVVNVKAGFARNYLLPHKKAIIANESNFKNLADLKNRQQGIELRRIEKVKALASKLQTVSLKATLKMGEEGAFGVITNSEIAELLKQAGYEIDKHAINLEHPVNEPGVHDIPIKLAPEIIATVKLWVAEKPK
jgi:large subunit ribosomal protein L9